MNKLAPRALILGLAAAGCGRNAIDAGNGGHGGSGGSNGGAAGAGGAAGGMARASDGGTADGGPCAVLTSYTPTTTAAISFQKDVYPILIDMGSLEPVNSPGCAAATICHGSAPIALNSSGPARTLSFTDPPSMVLAALMKASVNAPSMRQVVPGSVAQSFLAYKISGATGQACANSMCISGASVGTSRPCGDPMPTSGVGILSAAERTKILDWIANGAAN